MMRARIGIGLALIVAIALMAGCDKKPTDPGGTAVPQIRIFFASNRPPSVISGSDVYQYDAALGTPAVMPPNVNTPYLEYVPAISGNGSWLAYNTTNTQIVGTVAELLMNRTIDSATVVLSAPTLFQGPYNPSLSYDGTRLTFQTQLGAAFDQDVVLVDVMADSVIPTPHLHALGAADFDPSISGDGKLIAFTTTRHGTYDIALYDVAGDSLLPLPGLNTNDDDLGVSISRDGRFLAFHSNRPGGEGMFDIYVYDRVTRNFLPLPGANTAMSELNPALSPDGRYVAYSTDSEGGGDIRLYDIGLHLPIPLPGLNDPYFADKNPSICDRR